MLPVQAPWSKISEVIDYVREVEAAARLDIHDALLTDLARPDLRPADRRPGRLGTPAGWQPGESAGPLTVGPAR